MRSLIPAVALLAAISVAAPPGAIAQQPELPRFRSAVDLTSIDVAVLDDRGKPVQDLKPGDFAVRIDGKDRPVVTVQWVPLAAPASAAPPPPPEGYSSNENATGGRLILIVVDEVNIRAGGSLG